MPEFTDEQMDARLRDAGARWREATPVPALAPADRDEVDIEHAALRHRPRAWLAALTGAALVAAAVLIGIAVTRGDNGTPQPAGRSELVGTTWQFFELRPSGTERFPEPANLPAGPRLDASLEFTAGGKVSGRDGCNSFSGPVDIRASELVFGDLATTAMACPATQTTADLIDRIVVGEVGWRITNGYLVLTKPGVGTVTYAPKPAPTTSTDPKDLVGVTWGLSGVEHDTGNAASGAGSSDTSTITLIFDGARGYRVEEPCRVITGNVLLGGGSAVFSNRMTQEHSCPIGAADAGMVTAVDDVLAGATTWSITDRELTIAKGPTKLTFSRMAAAPRSALTGTTWVLAEVSGPAFRQTIDTTRTKLKLTVDQRGSLSVDDGVNFHSVPDDKPVAIGATTITLTDLASTAAGCAPTGTGPNPCTRAAVIADFFTGTIGWSLTDNQLTLIKGATTLVYVRA